MRERRRLDEAINATRAIERELADTAELIELAETEGDEALVEDGVKSLADLAERAERDKVAALLAGEADANNAYVEVNAGAGGTESQDWAGMLQRMYTRWGERHGMKVDLIDHHSGEQADRVGDDPGQGRKRLRQFEDRERGPPARPDQPVRRQRSPAHQLRQRLGLSRGRRRHRHPDQQIRAAHRYLPCLWRGRPARQHYRQRGPDHPRADQIVVSSQNDRSQHKTAPGDETIEGPAVRGRVAEREAVADEANAAKTDIGWGHQIRSYVLQPYQLVKDLRTG